MQNCRSIPTAAWEHARRALVFYFSRRCSFSDAEDLAQETLAVLWSRDDYKFEREEDFLRVAYAFGRRVRAAHFRRSQKHASSELDDDAPAAMHHEGSADRIEMTILLDEVCHMGSTKLQEHEWKLIQQAAVSDSVNASNKQRVQLHRARKKLLAKIGWLTKKV